MNAQDDIREAKAIYARMGLKAYRKPIPSDARLKAMLTHFERESKQPSEHSDFLQDQLAGLPDELQDRFREVLLRS